MVNINAQDIVVAIAIVCLIYFFVKSNDSSAIENLRKNKPTEGSLFSVGDKVTVHGYTVEDIKSENVFSVTYRKNKDAFSSYCILMNRCSIYAIPMYSNEEYIIESVDGKIFCAEKECLFKE